MKFTFHVENTLPKDFEIGVEFEAEYIGDVVEKFELFLRGAGFHQQNIDEFIAKDE